MLAAAVGKQRVTEADQDPPFHVVFSTSCSPFQDWQALLVFLSAEMVGQKVSARLERDMRDIPRAS